MASSAFASPPDHAPAHGYRNKHKGGDVYYAQPIPQPAPQPVYRNAPPPPRQDCKNVLGAAIGGATGAVIGTQVGSGLGNTLATGGGAAAGAVIGSQVGCP